MRSLILDEMIRFDVEKLARYLRQNLISSVLDRVFWLEMPYDLLTKEQLEHKECSPHRVALLLEKELLRLEFLVRSLKSLHCSCTAYATSAQRAFIINYADKLIDELDLMT